MLKHTAAKSILGLCKLSIYAGMIGGFFLGYYIGDEEFLAGIIGGGVGFIVCYLSSLFMIAFAELCIDVAELNRNYINDNKKDDNDKNNKNDEKNKGSWYSGYYTRPHEEANDKK